jgi:hypothetical protein
MKNIPTNQTRPTSAAIKKNILIYGALNTGLYIILFLAFRMLGLLHFVGLRMINYVVLCLVSFYQIKKFTQENGGYLPFLISAVITLCTGTFSFFLFALFIYIFSFIDPYLSSVYFDISSSHQKELTPFILILFEGTGACIIIALIIMIYAEKLKEKK